MTIFLSADKYRAALALLQPRMLSAIRIKPDPVEVDLLPNL